MNEDELVLAAMKVLQRKVEVLRKEVEEQQAQITEAAPKVEAFNHLMNSVEATSGEGGEEGTLVTRSLLLVAMVVPLCYSA